MATSRPASPKATKARSSGTAEHDQGYKLLFSQSFLVEQLLRGFLPGGWADELDFSTLEKVGSSFVSDDLRERHDDIIWKLRWKGEEERWFWVYLLLEFQSTPDPFMPVRLLAYVGLLLQELIRQGKVKPGDPLPAVLPVVLYHGKARWRAPLDLASLFTAVPPSLKEYLPQLRYLLIDEGRLPLDGTKLQGNLAAALFRIETAPPEETFSRVQELADLVPADEAGLRRAFSVWLARLFRRFSSDAIIPSEIDLEDVPMIEQTLEEWGQKLRQEGRQEGLLEGQKAAALEMQKLLFDMIRQRFGPIPHAVQKRIKAVTSLPELRKLSRRILSASSLDELGLG